MSKSNKERVKRIAKKKAPPLFTHVGTETAKFYYVSESNSSVYVFDQYRNSLKKAHLTIDQLFGCSSVWTREKLLGWLKDRKVA